MPTSASASVHVRRAEAYAALGVRPVQLQFISPITPQLNMLVRALRARKLPSNPYYYLKCSTSPAARKVVELYFSLPKSKRILLPIEAYCAAAGVDTIELFTAITQTCTLYSRQSSAILAAVSHPKVVEKTIEVALTDEGYNDRVLLHKAAGFLPAPKGAHTSITLTQNANANALSAASSAPPPESTIRRLANRFNERIAPDALPAAAAPALPADTGSIRIPDVMPHEDQEAATLIAAHDEDEYELEEE